MSTYEILEVSNSPKEFVSQHGPMVNYSVKLKNDDGDLEWVQLVQKLSSPVPKAGDALEGSIEKTDFGPKFKKEFKQQGYGGGSKPRAMSDSYAMYVSYAKDIVVAYMQHDAMKTLKPDVKELTDVVAYSAKKLWESRPDNNKES